MLASDILPTGAEIHPQIGIRHMYHVHLIPRYAIYTEFIAVKALPCWTAVMPVPEGLLLIEEIDS